MDGVRIALDSKRKHGFIYQNGQWIRGFEHDGTGEHEVLWHRWQKLEEAFRDKSIDWKGFTIRHLNLYAIKVLGGK